MQTHLARQTGRFAIRRGFRKLFSDISTPSVAEFCKNNLRSLLEKRPLSPFASMPVSDVRIWANKYPNSDSYYT